MKILWYLNCDYQYIIIKKEKQQEKKGILMGFFFLNKYGFSFLFLFWFYVYFFFNIIIDKYSLSIIKSLLKDGAEIV